MAGTKYLRPRYTLATLFIAIAVVSIVLAIWSYRERRYRARLAACEELRSNRDFIGLYVDDEHPHYNRLLGGADVLQRGDVVNYVCVDSLITDDELSAILCFPTLRALAFNKYGPTNAAVGSVDVPLRKLSRLPCVEWIDLGGSSITDIGVANIAGFTSLRTLNLARTQISGTTFGHLASLRKLEQLNLHGSRFTDAGARHLGKLLSLHELDLQSTKISGAALEYLTPLNQLRTLNLGGTKLTDRSIRYLGALVSLEHLMLVETGISGGALSGLSTLGALRDLDLAGNHIDDESLTSLSHLPKLASLRLSSTQISDDGLMILRGLGALEVLNVRRCAVSDVGLEYLAEMSSLRRVLLDRSSVTAAGVAKFKSRRPAVEVVLLAAKGARVGSKN